MTANTVYHNQIELFEPSEYLFNKNSEGNFCILYKKEDGIIKQRSYGLSALPTVLNTINPAYDTYISQAIFSGINRRAVMLQEIGLMFSDLDTYNSPGLQGKTPEECVTLLLRFCSQEGLPYPSIVLFSGRGLQVKWLLEEAMFRPSVLRWNEVQRALCHVLDDFGSDTKAKDVSRVLRLVKTTNTKTGELVRIVYIHGDKLAPTRYKFNELEEALLPRLPLRYPPREGKIQDIERIRAKTKNGIVLDTEWQRLNDIRTLWKLRGGVKEGYRETTLFWCLNFLFQATPVPMSQFWYEAQALASEISPKEFYKPTDLTTLYNKALAYRAGERVSFNGKTYSPLYTPTNTTLAEIFGITPEEEKYMTTIISKIEKRRRLMETRWESGVKPRSESYARTKPWEAQGISRRTWFRRGCPL